MDGDDESGDENDDEEADSMEVSEENLQKLSLKNESDVVEMSQNGVTSGDVNPNNSNMGEITDTMDVVQEEAMEAEEESVFKLTIGPQSTYSAEGGATAGVSNERTDVFMPSARMNAVMAVKNGQLFLYGGMYEAGDRQYTFADFYSLDVHKLDEWNIIIENNLKDQVGLLFFIKMAELQMS